MQMFEHFSGLKLDVLLIRHSDNMSTLLQAKDLCRRSSENFEETRRNPKENEILWKIVAIFQKHTKQSSQSMYWSFEVTKEKERTI